jgi:predicted PurR-regulated permease PerM
MKPNKMFVFWGAVFLVFIAFMIIFKAVLLPFIVGLILGYALDPLADRIEKLGLPRAAAASVVLVGFFLSVILVFMLLLPVFQQQVQQMAEIMPEYIQRSKILAITLLDQYARNFVDKDIFSVQKIGEQYGEQIFQWFTKAAKSIWSGGQTIFDILSLLVITPIVAFYLLRDWDRLVAKVDGFLPRKNRKTIHKVAKDIDTTLAGFMRGQAVVCLLLGIFYAAGLTLAGLNFGLVIGIFIGIISFVPYVGAIFGGILCVGLAALQFQNVEVVAIVALIFAIGQFLEGNVLSPKFVGENVNLHPVWILFALMAGGAVLGFTGVIVAVPVAAVIGVMTRFGLDQYMQTSVYHGSVKAPKKTTKRRAETTKRAKAKK